MWSRGPREACSYGLDCVWPSAASKRKHTPEMPLLFSYGTLQHVTVQLSTFGRVLRGQPDELLGFEQSVLRLDDPKFVATSGKADHAVVRFNGRDDSRVSGMVFELSDSELAAADSYEPAGYKRILATLASGRQTWVYADARFSRDIG